MQNRVNIIVIIIVQRVMTNAADDEDSLRRRAYLSLTFSGSLMTSQDLKKIAKREMRAHMPSSWRQNTS